MASGVIPMLVIISIFRANAFGGETLLKGPPSTFSVAFDLAGLEHSPRLFSGLALMTVLESSLSNPELIHVVCSSEAPATDVYVRVK
jgi:hypothetical protein